MSRIKVLFDLSTVSKMHGLGRLSQLVPIGGNVIAYASTAFLEELSGLRRKHPRMYEEILDWYRSCTFGRLIKPWRQLIQDEIRTKQSVWFSSALEPASRFHEIMNVLRESRFTTELAEEVFQSKRNNEMEMNITAASIRDWMRQRLDNQAETKQGWKEWRLKMPRHVQDWARHCFGPRYGLDYTTLPHLTAYFGCFFVKHFMSMAGGRKHCGSDRYDHGYYVESTTLGNFVSCDKNLRDTIKMIPWNTVEVHSGEQWIERADCR